MHRLGTPAYAVKSMVNNLPHIPQHALTLLLLPLVVPSVPPSIRSERMALCSRKTVLPNNASRDGDSNIVHSEGLTWRNHLPDVPHTQGA